MGISGVYRIVNTITGDYYIGSSNDLEKRKRNHFCKSSWKQNPTKPLYKAMKQYGKDNFLFEPILLCKPEELKKYEQIAIEKYNPKYNVYTAYTGLTREQYSKQYHKQYNKENSDSIKQYKKQYYEENIDSIKQYQKQYNKENATAIKQQQKQYYNQQCLYEGELLSLSALSHRFIKKGIQHPVVEAKKYLIQQQ